MSMEETRDQLNQPVCQWIEINGIVSLSSKDGGIHIPDSKNIFAAEFRNQFSFNGKSVEAKPSEMLTGLIFSPYPLDLYLEVSPPLPGSCEAAHARIRGKCDDKQYDIILDDKMPDHIVLDGIWYPLVQENIDELVTLLKQHRITCPGRISLKNYLDLRKNKAESVIFNDKPLNISEKHVQETVLPEYAFTGKLYPYQETGFTWMRQIGSEGIGCILADEMGLGKTIQLIALLADTKKMHECPCLVIAPATLLENWRREILRFSPSLTTLVHRGQERTGFPSELRSYDVVITSYDLLTRDLSLFKMLNWEIVILDEAQAIKNPLAQRTNAAKQIICKMPIAVTGTPFENHLTDLWSITDFVVPGYLGNLRAFNENYPDTESSAAALEPFITPIMIRRRVSEVAQDLPEKIEIPQVLEFDSRQAADYDRIRSEIHDQYGPSASLVSLTRMRMYCAHPSLISDEGGLPEDFVKYQRLMEILEEIFESNAKVLVFTSYTDMTDLIRNNVRSRFNVYVNYIDGRVSVDSRQTVVDEFNNHRGPGILILNPRAAGTGLNITGASHVIHYNLEWNPSLEDQATARAYRRGQTETVTVHRLYIANTVEEVINDRIEMKRGLAGNAVIGHVGQSDSADIARALELSPL